MGNDAAPVALLPAWSPGSLKRLPALIRVRIAVTVWAYGRRSGAVGKATTQSGSGHFRDATAIPNADAFPVWIGRSPAPAGTLPSAWKA